MNLKKHFEIIKHWFKKLCLKLKHKSVEEIIVTDINQIKFHVGDIISLTPDNYKLLVGCLIQQGYCNNDLTELTNDMPKQVLIELLPHDLIIPRLPEDASHIKYVILNESNSEHLKDYLYEMDYYWAGGDSIIEFWPNNGYIVEISPRQNRLRYARNIWHLTDYGKQFVINPEVYEIDL